MNSVFTKNVVILITGNIIAFIIPVIFYPILSRIYSPADYALFGLYVSIFSFLEIASAGRYDFAIVIPENDDEAVDLVAGGFMLSLLYSLLVMFLVVLLKDLVAEKLNNPGLANWLFLLPFSLLFISVTKLCNGWLIRKKRFKAASTNKAAQKLAETSSQFALGLTNFGNGLVIGDLAGRLFNSLFSLFQSLKTGLFKKKFSRSCISHSLIKYSEFPRYGILPSMLNTLAAMLPVFLISSYYSVEVSGSFNFSRIVLSVPFALISSGIAQVLMQQVTERKHRKESISKEIFSLGAKMIAFSSLIVLPLHFAGPELFQLIFGTAWRQAGEYTSLLIIGTAVSLVVSPFSMLLIVLGKIKLVSFWQTFYFVMSCVLWLLRNAPIEEFLLAIVIVDCVAYLVYAIFIYKVVREYEKLLKTETN